MTEVSAGTMQKEGLLSDPNTSSFQGLKVPERNGPDVSLVRWQNRLLPFMTSFIIGMSAIFFLFSGLHVYQVTRFIQAADGPDTRAQIQNEISRPTGQPVTPDEVMEHSLLLLEADALDKRYHQAGGLLMSRIWSRQLAFITGMVMAFVGAAFILGKLSENVTEVSGGASEWKVAISSASPGIILSFFGTVVIVASLFVRASLDVNDGPAYVQALHPGTTTAIKSPEIERKSPDSPPDLKELQRLEEQKKELERK
jgi:hypothetical protein